MERSNIFWLWIVNSRSLENNTINHWLFVGTSRLFLETANIFYRWQRYLDYFIVSSHMTLVVFTTTTTNTSLYTNDLFLQTPTHHMHSNIFTDNYLVSMVSLPSVFGLLVCIELAISDSCSRGIELFLLIDNAAVS